MFSISENECTAKTASQSDIKLCLDELSFTAIVTCLESITSDAKDCNRFKYDTNIGTYDDSKFSSMVTDFNLVCDRKWIPAFLTSMTPASVFIGAG